MHSSRRESCRAWADTCLTGGLPAPDGALFNAVAVGWQEGRSRIDPKPSASARSRRALAAPETFLHRAYRGCCDIGYPPDLQDAAVKNVPQQAEALSAEWAALLWAGRPLDAGDQATILDPGRDREIVPTIMVGTVDKRAGIGISGKHVEVRPTVNTWSTEPPSMFIDHVIV